MSRAENDTKKKRTAALRLGQMMEPNKERGSGRIVAFLVSLIDPKLPDVVLDAVIEGRHEANCNKPAPPFSFLSRVQISANKLQQSVSAQIQSDAFRFW